MNETTLYAHRFDTDLGKMLAIVNDAGALRALAFCEAHTDEEIAGFAGVKAAELIWDKERGRAVETQVREYLAGTRQVFDLPIALKGTPFQQTVWQALQAIPYGATLSYGELAARIGKPSACRAVGQANGANRIALVVPCHRVVGASGTLTGYASGTSRKAHLLALEKMGTQV